MNNIIKAKLDEIYLNAVKIARREDGSYRTRQENKYRKRMKRKLTLQYKYIDDQLRLFSDDQDREAYVQILMEMPEQEGIANLLYDEEFNLMDRGATVRIQKDGLERYNVNWNIEADQPQKFLQSRRDFQLLEAFSLEETFAVKAFDELNLHQSTQKQLYSMFEDTFGGKMTIPELRRKLKSDYVFTDRRADLITYRASAEAFAQGEEYVIKDFEVRNPERVIVHGWVTVGDMQVTRECMANQIQGWIPRNQAFASGDMTYPRKSHPSVCRCNTVVKILAPDEDINDYLKKRDGDKQVIRNVSGTEYSINKRENDLLDKSNVKITETDGDIAGARGGYDYDQNIMTVNGNVPMDKRMQTFLHEYGHALDDNFDKYISLSSKEGGFKTLIFDKRYKHGLNEQAVDIIYKRFERNPESSFQIPRSEFSDFLSGREVEDITGIKRKASGFVVQYYGSRPELFAEAYLQYRTNPDFADYAPDIKRYFDYITSNQDIN